MSLSAQQDHDGPQRRCINSKEASAIISRQLLSKVRPLLKAIRCVETEELHIYLQQLGVRVADLVLQELDLATSTERNIVRGAVFPFFGPTTDGAEMCCSSFLEFARALTRDRTQTRITVPTPRRHFHLR